MPMPKRTIRRGQIISPYGPGSIIDIKRESFIARSAENWQGQGKPIHEVRLEKLLGKDHFCLAPEAPNDNIPHPNLGIPVSRFPDWLFCGKCRLMIQASHALKDPRDAVLVPYCPASCRVQLTPMRFIAVCPRGHIDDVPWVLWCHSGAPCSDPRLRFHTGSKRGGLEDLYIECDCGRKRSLEGITKPEALKQVNSRCTGRQPWEPIKSGCDIIPLVKQRGATNIHFSHGASSIDIPPYSDASTSLDLVNIVTNTPQFATYKESPDASLLKPLATRISKAHGLDLEIVVQIMKDQIGGKTAKPKFVVPDYSAEDDLKQEEYKVFLAPRSTEDAEDNFQKRDVSLIDAALPQDGNEVWNSIVAAVSPLISRLVLITRLREVRVIESFSRLEEPPATIPVARVSSSMVGPEPVQRVPVASANLDWLPAVEVFGEGIFFTLNTHEIAEWVKRSDKVRERAGVLRSRQATNVGPIADTEATAPFILLHTLSHLLIRQLSFDCGYGSSSLRERLYTGTALNGTPMAGALIYTSAGDSEGTLGGLVRQGSPASFVTTLVQALQNAAWCSSDPLCSESQGQGLGGMNLAACYACTLLPETSCSSQNRLLDRALVVGTPLEPSLGYFHPVLEATAV